VTKKSVVVVGAGFGGLEAAKALAHSGARVTIVDRKNHHCFQPLLYQVATASLSPADVAWPIRSILARQENANVLMAEVSGVDAARKVVKTSDGGQLSYDYLVLATGATHSYFAHPEWGRIAPGLKTIEDATEIRGKILLGFERAERADDLNARSRHMTFIVIGGGPTGVELAGSIADIAHHALSRDFRRIRPELARIILVEAGPRVLAAFPEDLAEYARTCLVGMGVEVITGRSVVACDSKGVWISDGSRIASDCVLWAAGVRASGAASWLGVAGDRAGRLPVDNFLRVPGVHGVFAIGDTAQAVSEGAVVPGIAPAAKQMGRYVGEFIAAEIKGIGDVRAFKYRHQGDLATIGRKSAVVALKNIKLKGFSGWLFWSVAHIYFLLGVRNRLVVAINWMWEYVTFQRGARLISRSEYRVREIEPSPAMSEQQALGMAGGDVAVDHPNSRPAAGISGDMR
jgi:NADH:ubiquinone reductase (H+-translocating)